MNLNEAFWSWKKIVILSVIFSFLIIIIIGSLADHIMIKKDDYIIHQASTISYSGDKLVINDTNNRGFP